MRAAHQHPVARRTKLASDASGRCDLIRWLRGAIFTLRLDASLDIQLRKLRLRRLRIHGISDE